MPTLARMQIRIGAAPIVRRAGWWIEGGRFSPDGRWIAFSACPIGNQRHTQIFVAPYTLGEAVEIGDWLPILDEPVDGHLPDWSPNGEILYFLSDRDGCRCLWYQRLDPNTKRPIGAPQELHHFGQYRQSPQFQHYWDFSASRSPATGSSSRWPTAPATCSWGGSRSGSPEGPDLMPGWQPVGVRPAVSCRIFLRTPGGFLVFFYRESESPISSSEVWSSPDFAGQRRSRFELHVPVPRCTI